MGQNASSYNPASYQKLRSSGYYLLNSYKLVTPEFCMNHGSQSLTHIATRTDTEWDGQRKMVGRWGLEPQTSTVSIER